MEEANEQHEKLIADLQSQVLEIRKSLEAQSASPLRAQTPAAEAASARQTKTILWVDDNPKNNSYSVQRLTDLNIRVDIAQSTSEALARFAPDRYAYVISDMGRQEDGVYNPDAGVDLLKAIRERDKDVPFIIFSSPRATAAFGPAARALGATALTSSTTELFGILGIDPSKS